MQRSNDERKGNQMGLAVRIKKKLGDFCLDVGFQSESSRIGILGASGCGKSMTLKSIAGIETPDQGEITVNGQEFYHSDEKINVKPQKRKVGYLFQNYALFPTMTVAKNIEAGLKGSKQAKKKRVDEMIRTFQLEGLKDRLPGELSGGQQQRAALARIMAYEPDVILLDEPFSAMDMFLKDRLQQELIEMLSDYRGIVILVSHNRDEIYRFSEELIIMDRGAVVTSGKTKEIFANPGKREAARLTGCKNISRIQRLDAHRMKALDWGAKLTLQREIPEGTAYVGFRAHEFIPVWGERRENCIRVRLAGQAELPFEKNFYLFPETGQTDPCGEEGDGEERQDMQNLCWFLQKDKWRMLEDKGMPDYLQFREEQLLLLS